jgi:hypothetical protein
VLVPVAVEQAQRVTRLDAPHLGMARGGLGQAQAQALGQGRVDVQAQ